MKRAKVSEKEILAVTGADSIYEAYRIERKRIIEADQFLDFDRVQDKVYEVLDYIARDFETVLVTLRSNPTQLHKELERLNLRNYFSRVLSAEGDRDKKWMVKADLIRGELGGIAGKNYFIGDTETDVNAGKELGCSTIGVLNGIRNESILRELKPTWVIATIGDLINIKID